MRDIPRANQIYRHFKGNLYRIITIAQHSETGEAMAVYQALYGEYLVYARDLAEFMSPVDRMKYPDADQANRFELLTEMIGQESERTVPVSDSARPHMEQPEAEPRLTRPVQVRVNYDRKLSASAESVITRSEEKRLGKTEAPKQSDEKEQAGAGMSGDLEESENSSLDPLLMKFLDAGTYQEKLNLLVALHPRITDSMINTMAVSLDVEVNDGDIEDRYEALKTCLVTLEKYECNRLR